MRKNLDTREKVAKQVIVVRADLKMRRGKEIAQGSHASIAFISRRLSKFWLWGLVTLTRPMWVWFQGSFAKVVCQVNSEEELRAVHAKALAAGLESHLIIDSGKTEFHGEPTPTTVGIGPDYVEKFQGVTDNLRLR